MNLARYKYIVQVVIGEQRGEGVRMGSRCFWDSETDNIANETYVNVRTLVIGAYFKVFRMKRQVSGFFSTKAYAEPRCRSSSDGDQFSKGSRRLT